MASAMGAVIVESAADRWRGQRAAIVAPAQRGVGGLGGAGMQMEIGLAHHGLRVSWWGPSGHEGRMARMARRVRMPRRSELARALDRRDVLNCRREAVDLVYAMPGFLPDDGTDSTCRRVLHQATRHPQVVLANITRARALAGGGRGFLSRREAALQEDELTRADLIRAESPLVAADLVAHGIPTERIVVASPGVDLRRFQPGAKPSRLLAVHVGPLSLWKGIHLIAETAQRLAPDIDLVLIGGPVCPWSRRVAASIPVPRQTDVPATLGGAHALLLPSFADGFGYVVLEAMASGAVPFVSPEAGAADVVGRLHPDLVVPLEDYVDRVPRLLRELDLDQLGRAARRLAEDYELEAMATRAAASVLNGVAS
jgi:glycosyltransferase involved in cell wall biosynthesis